MSKTGLVHRTPPEHPLLRQPRKPTGRLRRLQIQHLQEALRRNLEDILRRLFLSEWRRRH